MIRHRLRNGVFLTVMLDASAACAGADIVQCVDQQGRVTLTDAPCAAGVQSAWTTGMAEHAAPPASDLPATALAPWPAAAAHSTPVVGNAPAAPPVRQEENRSRPLARDVETLKAARVSLQALDAASAAPRH